jgi:hypothetical protein
LAANDAVIFAKAEGNTMTADVPRKLKHLSVQVAIAAQTSVAFSHGLQQSGMSSVMETPAASGDLTLTPALPAAGRIATEKAI